MKIRPIKTTTRTFEHKDQPLASGKRFRKRVLIYFSVSFSFLFLSLFIGMVGYKTFSSDSNFGWDDAFLNASMILTGMGPIINDKYPMTSSLKIFSGIYAIYSGIAFLSSMAIFFSPIIHRFLHTMHIDIEEQS
jgi:hypothetical protein